MNGRMWRNTNVPQKPDDHVRFIVGKVITL